MCYLELLFLFLEVKEVREVNLGVKEVREVKAVCFANHRRSSVPLDNNTQGNGLEKLKPLPFSIRKRMGANPTLADGRQRTLVKRHSDGFSNKASLHCKQGFF